MHLDGVRGVGFASLADHEVFDLQRTGERVRCDADLRSARSLGRVGYGDWHVPSLPDRSASGDARVVTDEKALAPRLRIRSAEGETVAVALVLHGGKARSMRPASRRQLSAVRMTPFGRALHRAGS